jgi:hypothetical protein
VEWTPLITALVSAGFSAGLGGFIGARVAIAKLETRVGHIENEIGTRETGLRGAVHTNANAILKVDGRVDGLEDRVTSLEEWRKRPRR